MGLFRGNSKVNIMTYAKLKDGRIMVVWSDNMGEDTMHLYNLDKRYIFDVEVDTSEVVSYADIEQTDTNLVLLNPNGLIR